MALYAFDGTGNEDRDGLERDSNACDFFTAYDDPLKNDDPRKELGSLYLKGIGTRATTLVGIEFAKAFGIGGHRRVRQAIDRLENNFEDGDKVIDVIGFSRGAALAISFANEVAAKLPQLSIRFIGVWDIVGQFGVPGEHINAGHNLHMPPNAKRCYHAMALDEARPLYPLTRLGKPLTTPPRVDGPLVEVWFRGVHSDVGGGNTNAGLNWISLHWMFQNALRDGLPIRPEAVAANLLHNALAQQISDNQRIDLPDHMREILKSDFLHTSVKLEPGLAGRPHNNPTFTCARIGDDGQILTV